MFAKNEMSIGDWWLFFILMVIPLVNVIMFLVIIFSSGINKSLKNYMLALVLPFFIFIGLLFATGVFAGLFSSIQG